MSPQGTSIIETYAHHAPEPPQAEKLDLPPEPVEIVGLSCSKAFKTLKTKINKAILQNANSPWAEGVDRWWKLYRNELIRFIVIVHRTAADDFEDYLMWVRDHPNVPDNQRTPSYSAAKQILDYTDASGISGMWGTLHLVTRVSKWIVLDPKSVENWKKACGPEVIFL